MQIEDVGDAGDRQQAERAADRIADAAAQDRVAADHQRGVDLELEAEAGGSRRAAELADIDDAADAGAEARERSSADGPHPRAPRCRRGRRALVAADRLDVPAEPRLADDDRGDER